MNPSPATEYRHSDESDLQKCHGAHGCDFAAQSSQRGEGLDLGLGILRNGVLAPAPMLEAGSRRRVRASVNMPLGLAPVTVGAAPLRVRPCCRSGLASGIPGDDDAGGDE